MQLLEDSGEVHVEQPADLLANLVLLSDFRVSVRGENAGIHRSIIDGAHFDY